MGMHAHDHAHINKYKRQYIIQRKAWRYGYIALPLAFEIHIVSLSWEEYTVAYVYEYTVPYINYY